jgi:hypothetical protein
VTSNDVAEVRVGRLSSTGRVEAFSDGVMAIAILFPIPIPIPIPIPVAIVAPIVALLNYIGIGVLYAVTNQGVDPAHLRS